MEHHVKHVLMEATVVVKEKQSVFSAHLDISKCVKCSIIVKSSFGWFQEFPSVKGTPVCV